MTFLVADDSSHTRNLIKSYIGELDIRYVDIVEAKDSEETLKLLQTRIINFVLLDWNFCAEKTGLDVLKEIRKMDKYKHTPVFMVSSESSKFNVVEALKHGANDFVAKPIDRDSFLEKVTKIIQLQLVNPPK